MSERLTKRDYSPAAESATEAFSPTPEKRDEYKRRGLIATNNLGFKMRIYDSGPESEIGKVLFDTLSPRACVLLEKVRMQTPELWRQALEAYALRQELGSRFFQALQEYENDDPRVNEIGDQFEAISWRDVEFMTQVFDVMDAESLTYEEMMALCQ